MESTLINTTDAILFFLRLAISRMLFSFSIGANKTTTRKQVKQIPMFQYDRLLITISNKTVNKYTIADTTKQTSLDLQ